MKTRSALFGVMRKLKTAGLMAFIVALCTFGLFGKPQNDKDKDKKPKKKIFVDYQLGLMTEALLRREALITAMPVYPDAAIQAKAEGVVDVAVLFDENGEYMSMKVLESPHRAISKAVADAMKQWKIKIGYDSPYPESRLPFRNFAEVHFHFVIREGVGIVEPATEEEQRTPSQKFIQTTGPAKDRMSDRDWP